MLHIREFIRAIDSLNRSTALTVRWGRYTTHITGRRGRGPEATWSENADGTCEISNNRFRIVFPQFDGPDGEAVPAAFLRPIFRSAEEHGAPPGLPTFPGDWARVVSFERIKSPPPVEVEVDLSQPHAVALLGDGNIRIGCTTMTADDWLGAPGADLAVAQGIDAIQAHAYREIVERMMKVGRE
jgi:hypothetical protein